MGVKQNKQAEDAQAGGWVRGTVSPWIHCECTGTVFHLHREPDGIAVRCANPECGRWQLTGGEFTDDSGIS